MMISFTMNLARLHYLKSEVNIIISLMITFISDNNQSNSPIRLDDNGQVMKRTLVGQVETYVDRKGMKEDGNYRRNSFN